MAIPAIYLISLFDGWGEDRTKAMTKAEKVISPGSIVLCGSFYVDFYGSYLNVGRAYLLCKYSYTAVLNYPGSA